jgi:hypothetical protein
VTACPASATAEFNVSTTAQIRIHNFMAFLLVKISVSMLTHGNI